MVRNLTWAMLAWALAGPVCGDDWPQWRGPDRTDISGEDRLLQAWPEDGPPRQWLYRQAGAGYAGFAVAEGRLLTMGTRDDRCILLALDAETGEELWATPFADVYGNGWGDGPRATPTVQGRLVYAMSGNGTLICARLDSGQPEWQVTMEDFGATSPNGGMPNRCWSMATRSSAAQAVTKGPSWRLEAASGRLRWQAEDVFDEAQYSSIIPITRNGRREYVQLFMKTLCGVAAEDGTVALEPSLERPRRRLPHPHLPGQSRLRLVRLRGRFDVCAASRIETAARRPRSTATR